MHPGRSPAGQRRPCSLHHGRRRRLGHRLDPCQSSARSRPMAGWSPVGLGRRQSTLRAPPV